MADGSELPQSSADVTADVTVLLCVPRRVQERLQELHQRPAVHGVRFLLHEPDAQVEEEPPLPSCDLVVHKAVNDLALRRGDAAAAARYVTLQALAARGVPMLDPLDAMPLFADRAALCRALEAAGPSVARQPRYLEVCARAPGGSGGGGGGGSVLEAARAAGLRLPLLCKPLLACGPPASHDLGVALSEEGLRRVEAPVLLQEYVAHHGGTMLKGYCVGRHVHVVERPSLPDLRNAEAASGLVRFDSQQPLPAGSAFGLDDARGRPAAAALSDDVTSGAQEAAAAGTGGAWGLRRACVERITLDLVHRLGVQLLGDRHPDPNPSPNLNPSPSPSPNPKSLTLTRRAAPRRGRGVRGGALRRPSLGGVHRRAPAVRGRRQLLPARPALLPRLRARAGGPGQAARWVGTRGRY